MRSFYVSVKVFTHGRFSFKGWNSWQVYCKCGDFEDKMNHKILAPSFQLWVMGYQIRNKFPNARCVFQKGKKETVDILGKGNKYF